MQKNNHTEDSPNGGNRRKKDRRNETKAQADNKEFDSVALDMLEKNQKEKVGACIFFFLLLPKILCFYYAPVLHSL